MRPTLTGLKGLRMRMSVLAALATATVCALVPSTAAALIDITIGAPPTRTLDGSGNNQFQPSWGEAGTQYLRVGSANYADSKSAPVAGPPARYISNRIFNDVGQNLFSENAVSQWGWAWAQFIDHDFGLRDETPAEHTPIPFSATDPLESFTNDFGAIDFFRTPAAPGTGVTNARQQVNTLSSFIDASNVYGVTGSRLDWLREGSVDGIPTNNSATLLLPGGYLPRRDSRGNAAAAPPVDLMGALVGTPDKAAVAGDVRANENIALTAIHALFAREHNRIVASLPTSLSQENRFQIARRVVGAEESFITYNEFLPSLGVSLPSYRGYDPLTNPTLGNEFATVGYRAHSMVHGEFDMTAAAGTYSAAQLDAFRAQGIEVTDLGDTVELAVPLSLAFGNPDLLQSLGIDTTLASLGAESQYRNDEQIDNSMRSVLFQVPKPDTPDPSVCGAPVIDPGCFAGVADLGAIDVERARDHGMPTYNEMRRAFGLPAKTSFTAITGESTDGFPSDPLVDPVDAINDPKVLDFRATFDANGQALPVGSTEGTVTGIRRTTVAARLKAIYRSVDNVDAFVGMISEEHVPGTEFGELQLAMWRQQFQKLRDGDRLFYLNDPYLDVIRWRYGISYRRTLADIIRMNTGATVADDVFHAA
jgi:hypothetical protein